VRQLAGLACVVCHRSVDSNLEGRFCDECGGAIHKDCFHPAAAAQPSEGKCPVCGGDRQQADVALQREELQPPPQPAGPSAFTMNGIGTSYCFARGSGGPGGDALVCFVIGFMPILPYAAVHLYHEAAGFFSTSYRSVPLRWSRELVLRVYCLYWLAIPFLAGSLTALFATLLGSV
jgi:hypothetical protein